MRVSGRRRGERRPPEKETGNLRDDSRPTPLVEPAPHFHRISFYAPRIMAAIALLLLPLAAFAGFKLYEVYSDYAAIVDQRLDQQTLNRRAGVYAAPRRVRVGQKISQEELRDRLLRAGYRQGRRKDPPGHLSSGAFIADGDATRLRMRSFDHAANEPETVKIKFNRKNVVKIENAATGA
ncbi:MAG: hypothetical protein J2P21_22340, partial [Chloracidobacterium sp.]|nr:hypothetical protein [Chloracidobacterium sp.]